MIGLLPFFFYFLLVDVLAEGPGGTMVIALGLITHEWWRICLHNRKPESHAQQSTGDAQLNVPWGGRCV